MRLEARNDCIENERLVAVLLVLFNHLVEELLVCIVSECFKEHLDGGSEEVQIFWQIESVLVVEHFLEEWGLPLALCGEKVLEANHEIVFVGGKQLESCMHGGKVKKVNAPFFCERF